MSHQRYALVMLALGAAFAVALFRAAQWTAVHWVGVAVVTLVLLAAALALWHRQQMERHRRDWAIGEDWARVPSFAHRDMWQCPRCSSLVAGTAQAESHLDVTRSACAAFWAHQEKPTAAPAAAEGWPATYQPTYEEIGVGDD